jgi:hypothetical protein
VPGRADCCTDSNSNGDTYANVAQRYSNSRSNSGTNRYSCANRRQFTRLLWIRSGQSNSSSRKSRFAPKPDVWKRLGKEYLRERLNPLVLTQ